MRNIANEIGKRNSSEWKKEPIQKTHNKPIKPTPKSSTAYGERWHRRQKSFDRIYALGAEK